MGTFGQRLKDLRNSRGISQNELSRHIGVSKSSVNMYERDEREPGFETLEAIADFFNVNMDYLLGREHRISTDTAPADLLLTKSEVVDGQTDEFVMEIMRLFLQLDDRARSAFLGYTKRLLEKTRNEPAEYDTPMDIDSRLEMYRRGMLLGIATVQADYSILPENIDVDSVTLTPELEAMINSKLEEQRRILEAEQREKPPLK